MAINRVPYRTSLRVLGRLLNGDKARMVTVCEIDQGFLLHYFRQGNPRAVVSRAVHGAEIMDLDDALQRQRGKPDSSGALRGLLGFGQGEARRFQQSHPLLPMGYEEFLRALGDALDRRNAQALTMTELDDGVRAEYTVDRADFVMRNGQRMALPGRRQETYSSAQIATLARDARERAADQVRRSGQNLAYNAMDVTAYLSAAPVLEDHGQYREAEDLYRKALGVAPNHAEIHFRLAVHARRRGDHKGALKHLERATLLNNRDGRFFHLIGRIHNERHRFADAVQPLRHALACDPDNKIYQFHLSQVYERLGRTNEARAVLSRQDAQQSRVAVDLLDDRSVSSHKGHDDAVATATPPTTATVERPIQPPSDIAAAGASLAWGDATAPDETARGRSLAARLGTQDIAPAPAADEYATTPGPFDLDAPGWESGASGWEAAPASPTPQPALPPHVETATPSEPPRTEDGLPVLGLDVSNDWSTQALPALDLPSDGAEAGAALPMAGVSLDDLTERAPASEMGGEAVPGLAATAEPLPSAPDDAVRLAAAIMRAEEMVLAEPQRADLHRKLGFLLAKQGRSEEAAAAFRRAVECGRHRIAS